MKSLSNLPSRSAFVTLPDGSIVLTNIDDASNRFIGVVCSAWQDFYKKLLRKRDDYRFWLTSNDPTCEKLRELAGIDNIKMQRSSEYAALKRLFEAKIVELNDAYLRKYSKEFIEEDVIRMASHLLDEDTITCVAAMGGVGTDPREISAGVSWSLPECTVYLTLHLSESIRNHLLTTQSIVPDYTSCRLTVKLDALVADSGEVLMDEALQASLPSLLTECVRRGVAEFEKLQNMSDPADIPQILGEMAQKIASTKLNYTREPMLFKEFLRLHKYNVAAEIQLIKKEIEELQAEQILVQELRHNESNSVKRDALLRRAKCIYGIVANKRKVLERKIKENIREKSKGANLGYEAVDPRSESPQRKARI